MRAATGRRFDRASMYSLEVELALAPDVVVALYWGNMGAKQGLKLLPRMARMFAGPSRSRRVGIDAPAGVSTMC